MSVSDKNVWIDLVYGSFMSFSDGNFISALIGIICLFKEKPYKIIQINEGAPCAEDQVSNF